MLRDPGGDLARAAATAWRAVARDVPVDLAGLDERLNSASVGDGSLPEKPPIAITDSPLSSWSDA
ncbi:MAG: hypothetical protein R3C15_17530 [Thermoleophilia bacterium]